MKKGIIFIVATFLPAFIWTAQEPQKPKKVIFLWDLHHVVLKPHHIFRTVLQYPHKKEALKNAALQGKIFTLMLKGIFKESASDQFTHLAQQYNNPHLKELIIKATNSQKLIPETVAIIEELTANGYTHHIGSNIGATAFQALTDPHQFPKFASLFKNFDLAKSQVVAYNDGIIIKKPSPVFFKQYLAKNKIDFSTTRLIFIDDKKENIKTAQSLGIETIHFKNGKQLRSQLAKIGIIIQSSVV